MAAGNTVAFVFSGLATDKDRNTEIETRTMGKNKAIIVHGLHRLKEIAEPDAILIFLDCGEEALLEAVKHSGAPIGKIQFVICGLSIGRAIEYDEAHRLGLLRGNPILSAVCGLTETKNAVIDHYLRHGIITEPPRRQLSFDL